MADQHPFGYEERFKFTGKERDSETNYDYFGAHFYASLFGFWLSIDPLSNKYPNISPYAYCNWNPIKFVDPDGRYFDDVNEDFAQRMEAQCWKLMSRTKDKNRRIELSGTLQDIRDMREDANREYAFKESTNGIYGITDGGINEKGHQIILMYSDIRGEKKNKRDHSSRGATRRPNRS